MKCKKCNCELFEKDIVGFKLKERVYFELIMFGIDSGYNISTGKNIYRCPRCFETNNGKEVIKNE